MGNEPTTWLLNDFLSFAIIKKEVFQYRLIDLISCNGNK